MSANSWSPSKVPDVADTLIVPGTQGAVIAPGGITSGEAFGSATVTVGSSLIDFRTYFTTANVLRSVQTDLGVTLVSGGMSAWVDQSGHHDFAQATAGSRATMTTGLSGFPGALFDGVDDGITDTTLVVTLPIFVWGVYRIVGAPAGAAVIFGSTAFDTSVVAESNKHTAQFNGSTANDNAASAAGGWGRLEALFSGTTADYCKFGATRVPVSGAGQNAGTGTQTGWTIGGGLSSGFSNVEVLAMVLLSAAPSQPQLDAASAAVTSKYGATVAV